MNLYRILQTLFISLFFTSFAYSDIRAEFPSYSYVLTEFNIDENFIDNPEFTNFVHKNKQEFRKRYISAVNRGDFVIPMIKERINKSDISPLVIYIAMIESALKPKAVSQTGAGGLWQFTVDTGSKEFNMHVGNTLDERYDPIRATDSAIKYLYQMNSRLDSWYLTTMAYNCGNGCVNETLRRAGTRDLAVLISSENNYIKNQTKDYIQKVLLLAMIGENYLFNHDDNLGMMMAKLSKDGITAVKVQSGESLADLSDRLKMKRIDLENMNAHIKNGTVPYQDGYRVNIPNSRVGIFYNQYAQVNRPTYIKYAQR